MYEQHYAELALRLIHDALERRRLLADAIGADVLERRLREQRLHILAADALMWRDRTTQVLAAAQRRQAANEPGGSAAE